MAVKSIFLLDGTTAYAHDVEDLVNPLYTDIDDTNIRLGADIQIKKLEDLTSGQIIVGSAANVPTAVAMTGDASISNTGVVTVTGGSADEFAVTNDNASTANMYPVWVTATTGDLAAYVSSTEFIFCPKNAGYANASTLSVDRFIGALTGNVTGNCSGNAGTVTNGFYTTSSFNLGTTSIAVNRASAPQSLTGINIDGSSGSCTGNAATATYATSAGDADTVDGVHASALGPIPSTIVKLTSGSGNWTVPAGVTRIKVKVVGGGGGGASGGAGPSALGWSGGGGGGTIISDVIAQIVSTTPGATIAYSVGAGGAGGVVSGGNQVAGSNGASSTFGAITGAGSSGALTGGRGGAGASGGAGSDGGCGGVYNTTTYSCGGTGGGSGGAGGDIAVSYDGSVGSYGGGGGGGCAVGTGGAGGSGIIIIEY